jgi:hypothetical protein
MNKKRMVRVVIKVEKPSKHNAIPSLASHYSEHVGHESELSLMHSITSDFPFIGS